MLFLSELMIYKHICEMITYHDRTTITTFAFQETLVLKEQVTLL